MLIWKKEPLDGKADSMDQTQDNSSAEVPYYLPFADEIDVFSAAYEQRLPVLLKGPTGCGKTRFVEHMAHRIFSGKDSSLSSLETIACHEDLSATDMVGRFLLKGDDTVWQDGPLTRAVREGSLCYLDEIVEARKDSIVIIHSLTDHRRILPIDKLGIVLDAHPDFLLVISYNPGYQSLLKDLKTSTRQRFVAIEFDYPSLQNETDIIRHETGIEESVASGLALVGEKIRNLAGRGFDDGVSTRLLIYAAQLMNSGVDSGRACDVGIVKAASDEVSVQDAIREIVKAVFLT